MYVLIIITRNLKFGTYVVHLVTIPQNSSKLKTVATETWRFGIADFEALFGYEGLGFRSQTP